MKDRPSLAFSSFGGTAIVATAMGAVAVGAFAIGAFAIGWLAIRRLEVKNAYLKSLEIADLTVTRLHAAEVTVSDSLKLPRGTGAITTKSKKPKSTRRESGKRGS